MIQNAQCPPPARQGGIRKLHAARQLISLNWRSVREHPHRVEADRAAQHTVAQVDAGFTLDLEHDLLAARGFHVDYLVFEGLGKRLLAVNAPQSACRKQTTPLCLTGRKQGKQTLADLRLESPHLSYGHSRKIVHVS